MNIYLNLATTNRFVQTTSSSNNSDYSNHTYSSQFSRVHWRSGTLLLGRRGVLTTVSHSSSGSMSIPMHPTWEQWGSRGRSCTMLLLLQLRSQSGESWGRTGCIFCGCWLFYWLTQSLAACASLPLASYPSAKIRSWTQTENVCDQKRKMPQNRFQIPLCCQFRRTCLIGLCSFTLINHVALKNLTNWSVGPLWKCCTKQFNSIICYIRTLPMTKLDHRRMQAFFFFVSFSSINSFLNQSIFSIWKFCAIF